MASEVGNGQVAIFPTFRGFRGKVEAETTGAATSASSRFGKIFGSVGSKTGLTAGRGFKSAFDSSSKGVGSSTLRKLQSDVASASKSVSASRLKEQDATGKLRVAEAQLAEARTKNTAGSARLVAAEEKAASAARNLASAEESTRENSGRLAAAQARVKDATAAAAGSAERGTRSFRGAGSALASMASRASGAAKVFAGGLAVGAAVAGVALLGRGVRALTGYLGDSIKTAAQWSVLNAQSAAVVKSTGGAAQVTAGHVYNLSQALENQTATEAEAIQKGANLLLTFTGIRNEAGKGNKVFDQTTAIAVDMAKALGIDVSAAALQLGKALNDPAKGLTKLQRSGVTFTDQQKKQVVALVQSGKTLEAQKVILRELNKEFGGSGAAYARTYAGALYRIRDAAGDFGGTIAAKALPGISKLLSTGADLINFAAGTNRVKSAAQAVGDAIGRIGDKAAGLSTALQGKNPLQDAFKIVLPKVDFGQFSAGITNAINVAKPILTTFFSYLGNIGPAVGATLAVVGPALADVFTQLGPALQQTLPLLGQAATTLLPSVVSILQALIPLIPPLAQIIVALAPVVKILADGLALLITKGLAPLIGLQAGLLNFGTQFLNGTNLVQLGLDGLNGKFGPVLQNVARFGLGIGTAIRGAVGFFLEFTRNVGTALAGAAAFVSGGITRVLGFFARVGVIPGIAARAIGSFAAAIGAGIGRAVSVVGSGIARAIAFVGRVGQFAGIAVSAVGRFVGSLAAGFVRAVAAVASGIGRVLSTVRSLPGKVAGALGNLGGILVSSGRSLIEGFARGIRDAIGAAISAARDAVSAVTRFFPHSPAKEGPLSGKGYTLYSGRSAVSDFALGMRQSTPSVRSASTAAMQAAKLTAKASVASAASSTSAAANRAAVTIVNKTNVRLEDLIDVHVQNGFVQYEGQLNSASRLATGSRTMRQRVALS